MLQLLLLASAVTIATYPFRPASVSNHLVVSVLDVGQGDSILVVSPRGSTLLIDGGGAFEGFRGREEHWGRIREKRRYPRICGREDLRNWMRLL